MRTIIYILLCFFLSACPKKDSKSEFKGKRYPVMNKEYIDKQNQQLRPQQAPHKQDGLSKRVLGVAK